MENKDGELQRLRKEQQNWQEQEQQLRQEHQEKEAVSSSLI